MPLLGSSKAAAVYLIVQRVSQLHFPGGRSDREDGGIWATNPIGQCIIVLVLSDQPEGLGTWRWDRECPQSMVTSFSTGLAELG